MARMRLLIGTTLLYHFLSTIDYPNGQLILRRNTDESRKRLEAEARASGGIADPFYLAGDHYMLAQGTVNKSSPMLLFVDSGLGGRGG